MTHRLSRICYIQVLDKFKSRFSYPVLWNRAMFIYFCALLVAAIKSINAATSASLSRKLGIRILL